VNADCVPPAAPPVDSSFFTPHLGRVMAKPRKVEEPAGTYSAAPKPPEKTPAAQAALRLASLEDVRKTNAKLMQVHRKVLQKLAQ